MPVPQKGKITDGGGHVLAGGESLPRLGLVGHLFLFFIAALTPGGVGKTWTTRQRQTQWCHHKGNDLVGKMGLSMVSAGNAARALLGHGVGHQLQTRGSSICSVDPSRHKRASSWRQDVTLVLHQSLVTKPLGAKETSAEVSGARQRQHILTP